MHFYIHQSGTTLKSRCLKWSRFSWVAKYNSNLLEHGQGISIGVTEVHHRLVVSLDVRVSGVRPLDNRRVFDQTLGMWRI